MKKLCFALAVFMFAACAHDTDFTINDAEVSRVVRIGVSSCDASRAMLDGQKVQWQAGDQINVNGTAYALQGDETDGWYLEIPEAESYKAVYPADAVSGSEITLPATQLYTQGSFDPAAHPMYAEASTAESGLAFTNLCGLLKLSLTGSGEKVRYIELTGNNDEGVAGAGTIDGNKVFALASVTSRKSMTLNCGNGVALSASAADFYLVLPPQTFSKGFSLAVYTDKGLMQKSTTSSQQIVRSGILAMPSFEVKSDLRVLTFEDGDYKGTDNYLGNKDWSSLVDTPQYNGPLLYGTTGFGGSTDYTWYDENNTLLQHELPDNWGAVSYIGGGHAISNYSDMDLKHGDYQYQLAVYSKDAISGFGGHNGSKNFCVHYGYHDNSGYSMENLPHIYFGDGQARVVDHMYVMLTTYLANAIENGNGLTGAVGQDDYIKIVAVGYDENGAEVAVKPEFYLAGPDGNVTEWSKWDLSAMGKVLMIEFNMTGSNGNGAGFSQPAYFAYDDVAVQF